MDAREIIDYIATSPKRTPVKAYVREAAGAQVSYPQDAHVFGEGMSKIVFADWSSLAPVLKGASEDGRILDYVVESDRRNSGVPLLDLKGVNARIEPGALIREKVKIGDNAVIMMGAIVNIGAVIGEGTMIDMGAVLGGRAIEDDVMIGANAVVIEGVRVGRGAVVAAGAVVVDDVPRAAVVAGCPAAIIKMKDEGTEGKTALVDALRRL